MSASRHAFLFLFLFLYSYIVIYIILPYFPPVSPLLQHSPQFGHNMCWILLIGAKPKCCACVCSFENMPRPPVCHGTRITERRGWLTDVQPDTVRADGLSKQKSGGLAQGRQRELAAFSPHPACPVVCSLIPLRPISISLFVFSFSDGTPHRPRHNLHSHPPPSRMNFLTGRLLECGLCCSGVGSVG